MSRGRRSRWWQHLRALAGLERPPASPAAPQFQPWLEMLEKRLVLSQTVTPSILPIINPIGNANPQDLTNVNSTLFFSANDGRHGQELWKSDGTSAGTVLVLDINSGSTGSSPQNLTNVNGELYFAANDGSHGVELWKSNGTSTGTVLVQDINPSGNSYPHYLTNVSGELFFAADDGSHGVELWKSDGTSTGTVLVQDINPSGNSSPSRLTNVNGTLFFSANDGSHGYELWQSNSAGTVLVQDIYPGGPSSNPSNLTNVNGTLFFSANDGSSHGVELWKSSSAGTVLVQDINNGSTGSYPHYLTNVNGELFFGANDGSHGYELWQSDGTSTGTVLVQDIYPGSAGSSNPSDLTNVNGKLFFAANDGSHGVELWEAGASAGTVIVQDIHPGSAGSMAAPFELTNVNGTLFFRANDGSHGYELWKSDGTSSGTVLVQDIYSGSGSSLSSSGNNATTLVNVNGTLFFGANDGSTGYQLWKSDGTSTGTVLVQDINPTGPVNPRNLANVNGTVFFSANDGFHGYELWKSDGTTAGTVLVKDINPGTAPSNPSDLTNVSGELFFSANDGHGYELWKSDGTASGTVLVAGIVPYELTNVNGELFFASGGSLFQSDGSSRGTVLVTDNYPGSNGHDPHLLTNVSGTLYFSALQSANLYGTQFTLWKDDGSPSGIVPVQPIHNPPGLFTTAFRPYELTNVNGTLFFAAQVFDYGPTGYGLWKSNGSSQNTYLVKKILPVNRRFGGFLEDLTNVNGTLFFGANDGSHGYELWKSDGTSSGTVLVQDINPGTRNSDPFRLANVSGTLFFSANDGSHGYELWKSDGTSTGTVLVQDINLGPAASTPKYLTNVNGTLFFRADDGSHGLELWKSDGTSSGTVLVQDINPGSAASRPKYLTNVNGTLFFTANDGSHGYQLWTTGPLAANLLVTGFPSSTAAGNQFTVTVTAQDVHGQVVTNDNGTVQLSSSDSHAVLPPAMQLTNGIATFTFTLNTPGLQSISASDGVISGSENGIVVNDNTHYAQVDTTVDLNNDTVLLLDNPSGSALVQTLDSHFNVLHSNNFTISGWTAIKVAAGGDGLTRLLWVNNSTKAADLWLLNADDTVNSTLQIPFSEAGWQPVDVAVGSGGSSQTRLLWLNVGHSPPGMGVSGQAAVWTVSNNLNLGNPVSNAVVFGPIPQWSVRALTVSPTDVPWLLWDNGSTGQAALWTLNSNNNTFLNGFGYTALTSGWTAEDITVASDGNARLLWDNTDGTTAIWTINGGSLLVTGASAAGPYAGFTAVALEGGGDGLTRLVWTSSNGEQVVWLLNADGFVTSATTFGPLS